MKCLIVVVGPTAVGKSQLALNLAQHLDGEIVNADSRQVYRYLDIGTNKPTLDEQKLISHHIIDVVNPDEEFSLAHYCQLAAQAMKTVSQKGKLALLVGGSGLYIWSIVEGWKIPAIPPNKELRHTLETKAQRQGSDALYQELQIVDPLAASKIHPNNTRRIIRALEIYHMTKEPPSKLWYKEPPDFPVIILGLTMGRGELYRKIDRRIAKMLKRGFIEEVKSLLQRGYGFSLRSMSGIGYKQIGQFLQGEITLPAAIERISFETHRLVRHQYAWFHLNDTRIHWFDADNSEEKAQNLIEHSCYEFL
ncbi:MAG: tRNA (adenosine(37)-N6)-dimethylallyltransferase MiaA [Chloroflexota bacterium]|nr:tRNA (adenosine(37)-N6)-dimethylallyltransferase MiaA [Chloroflexota bacterium]